MRFLICGWGSIGRRHFRNLRALGKDDIVFYRTGRGTVGNEEIEDFPVERDLETALSRYQPDVAIISNPSALHLKVAIPAAQAGCDLMIEKPLAADIGRIDELRRAVDEAGVQVLVGYQFRFHPGLQRVKRMLDDGSLGEPVSVRVEWGEYLPDWHPWEDYRESYSARRELGGGVLLTLSHPFDYLRWLLGGIDRVTGEAAASGKLESDVEDVAEVLLSFIAGSLGSVHLDYLRRPPVHRMELICTSGSIRWEAARSDIAYCEAGGDWERSEPSQDFERNDLFMAEIEHLIAVSNGEATPVCTLEDGIAALRIALAARDNQGALDSAGVRYG
ncbi:MAG: Gfo/Idh/MocA family protein [Anaerolineales bacterium]